MKELSRLKSGTGKGAFGDLGLSGVLFPAAG